MTYFLSSYHLACQKPKAHKKHSDNHFPKRCLSTISRTLLPHIIHLDLYILPFMKHSINDNNGSISNSEERNKIQ